MYIKNQVASSCVTTQESDILKWYLYVVCCYSPELVQSEAYDEKADVWAAGCILYEMAALRAPFHSSNNILALATKVHHLDTILVFSGSTAVAWKWSLLSQNCK